MNASTVNIKIRPLGFAGLAVVALLAAFACLAPAARADFGIATFTGEVSKVGGEAERQAGSHPDQVAVTIGFNAVEEPELGIQIPDGGKVKDVEVELPPGLIGNPTAVAECSQGQLLAQAPGSLGYGNCPAASQVGVVSITEPTQVLFPIPLFNLEPNPGVPATFGFNLAGSIVQLDAALRSDGDYGIDINSRNISQSLATLETTVTMWGTPSDPSHNAQRMCDNGTELGCGVAADGAFITSPSDCSAGALTTTAQADSWAASGIFDTASFDEGTSGVPFAVEGCEAVPFEPKLTLQPTSNEAASPTGLEVELAMPQPQNPDGLGSAPLKRAVVTLPPGMAVNPAAASGQVACSTGQVGLGSSAPSACPAASKIGTVEVRTPLLDQVVPGGLYLAKQGANPFGSLLALYLVAELPERGVTVKLAGKAVPDPQTGRLTVSFDDNPQLPFSSLRMQLFGGPRAALVNPPSCGAHASVASLSPWSAVDPDSPTPAETVSSSSSFQITSGPGGGPCPANQFAPDLDAGTVNPIAGSYSPFVLRLTRADGTQPLGAVTATMPKGLLGKLKGIPYCSDAALASISGAEGTGAAQLAAPSCPPSSQVGTVSVGAGAGPSPFYVNTGKAYLAGPYKGAPLSLAFVTPAIAGPFDLGSVVVRAALQVNPVTAEITAVSDPLPAILHGIPLNLRDLRVSLDRPEFTLNPTSCDPMAFNGQVSSVAGTVAPLSERFQVAGCENLAFKPKFALRFFGKAHRGAYPRLKATLTMPGGANVKKAIVLMPKTELLENAHIRTICTREQWVADNCPEGSIYGKARAFTPLLDQPLEGNVYLRANGGARELPDLVADLRGQVNIELVGYIDAVNERLRARFLSVPDAPVSRFVLDMQGGKKGLLVHNTNVCKTKPVAAAKFSGQNGKTHDFNPVVKVACGKK